MSGRSMIQIRRTRGFTLIELMVGLGITAFLLMMVMPSIKVYLLDTKIRVAAQSYYDGAQMARSEALRRNSPVDITLNTSNQGWAVVAGGATIASKAAEAASILTVQASETTITFDAEGMASKSNTVQFLPGSGSGSACLATTGSQRCMNVQVSTGGQVRICDPSVSTDGDNRKC